MGFDIKGSPKQDEFANLVLRHPMTREPLVDPETKEVATIVVWSPDAPTYKARVRKKYDDRIKAAATNPVAQNSQRIEDDTLDLIVFSVKDWNFTSEGKRIEPDEETVRAVLSNPENGWIRENVDNFLNARASFINASPQP